MPANSHQLKVKKFEEQKNEISNYKHRDNKEQRFTVVALF